ncbi:ABC transporter ATP-binding protein [Nocardiopsis sp. HNM0947]|uniref:ABC transporter ATP-binding protein n=1 Tax=Nocardiopsis coralli TaxID=2772213 RepID=A0ABR9NZS7_9ACTN|nr:ABC transporter ATP-binding protein [Nocardiopsis coralli]MBE2997092.1 ABC transporter ATP-binding protein [Nocardiopsis coralli]
MSEPLLDVEDLRTTFHTPRGDVHAVDGVSLRLEAGRTLGVVGESGSGKSVLGRTVMGLVSSGPGVTVSGRVSLAGQDVHALAPAERRRLWGPRVAMVFQDPMTSLNPVKRVGRHIDEVLRLHLRLGRREARERTVGLLRQVGIPEPERRAGQYPHELSGGMRQRVVIAAALACGPDLLIADEPTTALDVTVQRQILDLVASLSRRSGMAVVLISHDLAAVGGRADRVAVMYGGRLVESAPTSRVFGAPRHPYTGALLASAPRLSAAPHSRLPTIEGRPPDPADPPPGCRFAPRCPRAEAVCRGGAPPLLDLAPVGGHPHEVACRLPLEAESTEVGHGR